MAKNGAEIIICLIFLITTGILLIINTNSLSTDIVNDFPPELRWVTHGLQNVLGYATIFIPGYLIYMYVRNINYLEKSSRGSCIRLMLWRCFVEDETIQPIGRISTNSTKTFLHGFGLLVIYFIGLQVSFLTWGVLQEKIMTQNYTNAEGHVGRFTNSQFLVLVNRILAFCLSGVVILCTQQPKHRAPLYKYMFCSLSNIMSSWCQYEALKYVSFLHQVLAKSAKTIPVMLMGKLVSKTKYELYEYVTVGILSVGMLFFMLDADENKKSSITTLSGIILLCSYLLFDSFTSNWQGSLFKQYSMSPIQMMCAVNMFSVCLTASSLLQQSAFTSSFHFMLQFPLFAFDCFLLSLCSAAGQLFIFKTIAAFGPLVFTIIMTIRQGLSILLSCLLYGHHIRAMGIFGIVLVFFSIFLRTYCVYRTKHRSVRSAQKV